MKLKVFHKNVMKVIKIKREDLKIDKKKKKKLEKIVLLVKELLRLILIILSRHPDLKPSTYEDSFKRAHASDSHLILSNSVHLGWGWEDN